MPGPASVRDHRGGGGQPVRELRVRSIQVAKLNEYAAYLPAGVALVYDRDAKTYFLRRGMASTGDRLSADRTAHEVEEQWHRPADVWADIARRCLMEGYND